MISEVLCRKRSGRLRVMSLLRTLVAFLMVAPAASATTFDVPYWSRRPVIDGDLAEWPALAFRHGLTDPSAPGRAANGIETQMTWNLDGLWMAARISDADLFDAPPSLRIEQFHQYDSVQVYLDPMHDSKRSMNRDDLDVLMLPDGRWGALRGDELIAQWTDARVPQRVSSPIAVQYAARRTDDGWSFELGIPWDALGVSYQYRLLKVDVAMNDWVVTHPPAVEPMLGKEALLASQAPDAVGPAPEVGTQLWPISWLGERDFGYPDRWATVRLVGGPAAYERWMRERSASSLLALGAVLVVVAAAVAAVVMAGIHRRRVRRLLARWEAEAGTTSVVVQSPFDDTPSGPQVVTDAREAEPASVPPDTGGARARMFADQVLAHVRTHLTEDLSPAALAERMHVSVRSLQRHLREGLNTSPQDLVLAARLAAARTLLEQGGLRVGEVAARVGFDDPSYFTRRFRAAYGISPSACTRSVASRTLADPDD